jgi:hypothetical protein
MRFLTDEREQTRMTIGKGARPNPAFYGHTPSSAVIRRT